MLGFCLLGEDGLWQLQYTVHMHLQMKKEASETHYEEFCATCTHQKNLSVEAWQ